MHKQGRVTWCNCYNIKPAYSITGKWGEYLRESNSTGGVGIVINPNLTEGLNGADSGHMN